MCFCMNSSVTSSIVACIGQKSLRKYKKTYKYRIERIKNILQKIIQYYLFQCGIIRTKTGVFILHFILVVFFA